MDWNKKVHGNMDKRFLVVAKRVEKVERHNIGGAELKEGSGCKEKDQRTSNVRLSGKGRQTRKLRFDQLQ